MFSWSINYKLVVVLLQFMKKKINNYMNKKLLYDDNKF